MPTPERRAPRAARELDAVFGALADPVRRSIVEELIAEPARTPTSLAANRPISRQAVAKHLTTLAAAGIVQATRVGREVRYEVRPEPLAGAVDWIAAVGAEWDDRLTRLADLVESRR